MRLIIFIVYGIFFLSTGAKAEDVYLNCVHEIKKQTTITLSYNAIRNTGEEYIGAGESIKYKLFLTNTDISLENRSLDGKFRRWFINRFSGNSTLVDNWSGKIFEANYNCSTANKKF